MQGFPIGGSRIRLSWGRSQCMRPFLHIIILTNYLSDKAAQAAAQAAQAAAFQAQLQTQLQAQLASSQVSLSSEQTLQLLQKLGVNGANVAGNPDLPMAAELGFGGSATSDEKFRTSLTNQIRSDAHTLYDSYATCFPARSPVGLEATNQHHPIRPQFHSSFSPFSPDPNAYMLDNRKRGSVDLVTADSSSQTLNSFPPTLDSNVLDGTTIADRPSGLLRTSNGCHPYGYFDGPIRPVEPSRSSSRQELVSRPTSSQTSSQGRSGRHDAHGEQDPIHDLNGTLASLDLDSRSPWRPAGKPTEPNTSC